jgi:hypothetical protein
VQQRSCCTWTTASLTGDTLYFFTELMYSLCDNCNHNAKYTGYVSLVCCHSHICFRPATAKTVAPRSGCSWTALYLRRWLTGGVRRRTRSTCRAGRWPPRGRTCRTYSGFPLRVKLLARLPCHLPGGRSFRSGLLQWTRHIFWTYLTRPAPPRVG